MSKQKKNHLRLNSFEHLTNHLDKSSTEKTKSDSSQHANRDKKNYSINALINGEKAILKVQQRWSQILSDSGLTMHENSQSQSVNTHSKPLLLISGTLHIECTNSLVKNHIRFNEQKIIDLCSKYSDKSIKTLKTVLKHKTNLKEFPPKNQDIRKETLGATTSATKSLLEANLKSLSKGPLKDSLKKLIQTLNKD